VAGGAGGEEPGGERQGGAAAGATAASTGEGGGAVSRPFPSWNRFILTEIYLCHACSCQEILRTETAGQGIAEIRSEHAGPTISFTEQMVFITARVVCGDTL
jgi:hypothetical protein